MQVTIATGSFLAILGSLTTAASADVCSGAYYVDLTPPPADCSCVTQVNDTVTVDYKAYFPNGTVFDQSYNSTDGPFVFQYGTGEVIEGFDQGLANMCVGEKRWIMIPPEFGYGNRSVGDGLIPPNSTLIFEVLLEDIQSNMTAKKQTLSGRGVTEKRASRAPVRLF